MLTKLKVKSKFATHFGKWAWKNSEENDFTIFIKNLYFLITAINPLLEIQSKEIVRNSTNSFFEHCHCL